MNIARSFLASVARVPEKTFLVRSDGHRYTYADTLSRARRFATVLAERGIGQGDRVILTFPNSIDFLCAYIGSLLHGCTVVPVDFRSRPQHLEYVRSQTGASAWVTPSEREEFGAIPDQLIFPADLERYPESPMCSLCPETPLLALIMFTSGSTGVPKGVRLSHDNLCHTIGSVISWARVDENDRELTTLSLTHLFGLAHIHVYWTVGGTVFVEDGLHDIPRLLEKISREHITSFPGTPGGFKMILDRFADEFSRAAGALKYIVVNSAPMLPEYSSRLLALLPSTRLYMYYGLTEASRSSYICYNDHPDKLATVGRPTPGSETCVGSPAKPLRNEIGEILVRGPHVTDGYLGVDSREYFVDGWFRTGDLGIVDDDGFLTWRGRLKEQINVDGLKLCPAEVEAVLAQHPRVRDCAVVGAPDALTGECVVAFVVAAGTPERKLEIDLRRFVKTRLEVFKVPSRVVFVDEIPRTDTGKPKRLSLRQRLLA